MRDTGSQEYKDPDFGSGKASSGIYGSGEAGAEDETDFFKLETI